MEELRQHYLTYLRQRNLEEATVNLHDYVLRSALAHAQIDNMERLEGLATEDVQAMVSGFSSVCSQRSLATLLPILRRLLEFFYEEGYGEVMMAGMVMKPFNQRGNVATYLSRDDEQRLLEQLEHETKRAKAIILLALRLGLRDSDICNLTLRDISWEHDQICLMQKKTDRPLVLPLLPAVGNALMDYILHERPTRDDGYPYVFLRTQAPYTKLSNLYHFSSRLFQRLQITPVGGNAVGLHLLRYTLVHRLLDEKVPHQVITDTLGHVSRESDKPYLSMEESMLRMCALDLSLIGKVSWEGR
jgi:integrase